MYFIWDFIDQNKGEHNVKGEEKSFMHLYPVELPFAAKWLNFSQMGWKESGNNNF